MFISEAFATTVQQGAVGQAPASNFISLVLVFVIFYFIIIRPQQKKMAEHEKLLNAIEPKDEVITGGGIKAKVLKIDGDYLVVEIAKDVEVKVLRSSIRDVVSGSNASSSKK